MSRRGEAGRLTVGLISLALVAGCAGASSTPVTAPPTPTPLPALPPEPRWERVADQEAFADGQMVAVAGSPDRYVAVGGTVRADGDDLVLAGAIWTSTDGVAWRRVPVPSIGDAPMGGVIHDRIGYIAWGYLANADSAAFWVSPDGESWSRAPAIPSLRKVHITGVARLGDELVATGNADVGSEDQVVYEFRTWTSPDGLAWGQGFPTTSSARPGMIDGVTAADGALIAWGSAPSGGMFRAVSLRSADGRRWEVGMVSSDNAGIADILAVGDRLVAVGYGPSAGEEGAGAPPRPSAAWTSTDGLAWNPGSFPPETSIGGLDHVVPYAGGYVALGFLEIATTEWRSPDGTAWTEGASAPDSARDGEEEGCTGGRCPRTMVSDLAAGPAGLVAVGSTRSASGGSRAVVWIAPMDGG